MMNFAAILKTSFRYLMIASLLASLGIMTGCKRSNLLDDDSTPNKVAPLQGSGQINCDDVNNRAECKTVDDRITR
ncbi:hypothetical protein [Candidatus Albibeggiatoa sp. nov. NOAA]|uniref:hypothetical protein n=1 Tax=Candidatus Albibeggiatoa sp. nov. NOAA TaxID=3162724 RepID=UPI0032F5537A|nr:hypothetical protein [Thiotrichaceae bacterium]